MSELIGRLKAGRRAAGAVDLGGVAFGLRLLTEADYFAAGEAALQAMRARGLKLEMETADLFESEKAAQITRLFLVDPGSGQPVFESVSALRDALTRGDMALAAQAYVDFEKRHAPSERNMSDEELADLLEEVKKSPQTPRLNDSSSATLKRLITSLACPPAS